MNKKKIVSDIFMKQKQKHDENKLGKTKLNRYCETLKQEK